MLYLGDGGVVADVLARVGVAPVVQREPLLGPGRCTVEDHEGFRVVLVVASWDG